MSQRSLTEQNHTLTVDLAEATKRAANLDSDIQRLQKDISLREKNAVEDSATVL